MYTLISYKSSSDDYCRGCHMASYSSDFSFDNHLTKAELINKIENIYYNNKSPGPSECSYQIIIMKDGFVIYNEIDNSGPDHIQKVYNSALFSNPALFEDEEKAALEDKLAAAEATQIIEEALDSFKKRIEREEAEKKRIEKAEKAKKIAENKVLQEQRERSTYERLKKKFEPREGSKEN